MGRVKKRSGELQEFDRTRLVESMKKAGAEEQVAKGIAEKVKVTEGASTLDLRQFISNELGQVNRAVAEAYARTLRLAVKGRDDLDKGAARVPKVLERIPDVRPGQPGRVNHAGNQIDVRIEPALEGREVWLNRRDLQALGATEGTRIPVRFLRQEGTGPQPSAATMRESGSVAQGPRAI